MQQVEQRVEQHLLLPPAELVQLLHDHHHRPTALKALRQLRLQRTHVPQKVRRPRTREQLVRRAEQRPVVLREDRAPHPCDADGRPVFREHHSQGRALTLDGVPGCDGHQRAANALADRPVHRSPQPLDDVPTLSPQLPADDPLHLADDSGRCKWQEGNSWRDIPRAAAPRPPPTSSPWTLGRQS